MQNLKTIQAKLGEKITLVGVTKHQPLSKIQSAIGEGLIHLGVNQAQAGEQLRSELLQEKNLIWHFIGHLQSRKTKEVVHYDWLDSLDRIEIAHKLNTQLQPLGRTLNVLVEINIGEESQKSGISKENLDSFLKELIPLPCLKVRGLMAMPPALDPIEKRRPYFKAMKELWKKHRNNTFDTLSMGTSEDYPIAIEEGATMVRLGTLLFGSR